MTKGNRFLFTLAFTAVLMGGLISLGGSAMGADQPKYVFFFLGDGMSTVQVNATEVYLGSVNNPAAPEDQKLAFSTFPVEGLCTTWAESSYITDSAAAGTAFACGRKTISGRICTDAAGTTSYSSVARIAKQNGMKVGIVSSVSIDHATPAVYYATQASRSEYYDISVQLANSDFDYFGGGGPRYPNGKSGDQANVFQLAEANGFQVVDNRTDFEALQAGQYDKVWAYESILDSSSALYYELDRTAEMLSLAEFTKKGIELLENPNGFFMMVEGGKIDWACHANDARSAIDDTLAFDAAVQEAVDFYNDHPNETLIVVTGDHECGGMTIGFAGTGYSTYFHILARQSMSYDEFDKILEDNSENGGSVDALMASISQAYGLAFLSQAEKSSLQTACDGGDQESCTTLALSLEDWEIKALVDAYWVSMTPESERPTDTQTYLLYGGYEPLSMAISHVLNNKAGIGWTSYAHTGVPVPVFAQGASAETFEGFYDNTDLYYKLLACMGMS